MEAETLGEQTYSICEVYFDKSGRLDGWTECSEMRPMGESLEDLIGDLQHVLDDARAYEPVRFEDLRPGSELRPTSFAAWPGSGYIRQ
jgi:hypothetical protein